MEKWGQLVSIRKRNGCKWMLMCRPGEDTEVDAGAGEPVTTVTAAAAVRS